MNTIASLTRRQPDVAEQVVEDLADLFRVSLSNAHSLTTIKEELELTRRYLNIETLRLGERLVVKWDISELPEDSLIPALMIQPLVENAVYHGIEPLPDGGTVRIAGHRNNQAITITITNPVGQDVYTNQRDGHRMAMDNIRLRLEALYENEGRLNVIDDGDQYQVTITLPYSVRTLA